MVVIVKNPRQRYDKQEDARDEAHDLEIAERENMDLAPVLHESTDAIAES
jgi:hypothetical protein